MAGVGAVVAVGGVLGVAPLHLQLGAVGVMAQGWMSEMGAAQRLLAGQQQLQQAPPL